MGKLVKQRFWRRLFAGLLVFCIFLDGTYPGSAASAEETGEFQVLTSYYAQVDYVDASDYDDYSLTLSWYSRGNNTGFYLYRKTTFEPDYQELGTIENSQYRTLSFTDDGFRRGITYTYKIVAYQLHEDGQIEELQETTSDWKYPIRQVEISSVKRSNQTSAKVSWETSPGVDGYEVYMKTAGGTFELARRIAGETSLQCTIKNISKSKNTSYKVRGYVKQNGRYAYGPFSAKQALEKLDISSLAVKFRKLQKQYPDGKYWNHVGKTHFDSTTVTNKPCHHQAGGISYSTCNYYECPNNVLGYQCYGFAWKMSDLIYGKSAKIKSFKSFDKCKAGDVIRYSGHSVIIVSKHKEYITAGECNYGDTCIIKWGRKIYRSELIGAKYSRRYK